METLEKYSIHLKGLTPLIMHSDKLCNPLDPQTKALKALSSIRKKQDEHYEAMARIEWEASIYYDEEIGVYLPSKCLKGCIQASARKFKLGKCTKGVFIDSVLGPKLIGYENRKPEDLWNVTNSNKKQIHIHAFSVVVNQARIIRTLPIFPNWEVKFDLLLNTEILSFEQFENIINIAGVEYGLCELRPESAAGTYGKFQVVELKKSKD